MGQRGAAGRRQRVCGFDVGTDQELKSVRSLSECKALLFPGLGVSFQDPCEGRRAGHKQLGAHAHTPEGAAGSRETSSKQLPSLESQVLPHHTTVLAWMTSDCLSEAPQRARHMAGM